VFHRLVGSITRDHIREHLPTYLEQASALQDMAIRLPLPKSFEVASFVGGVAGVKDRNDFPALSIDAYSKTASSTNEDFYIYRYDGQITGMVASDNPETVEQLAKGYETALEMFIRDHVYEPVSASFNKASIPFKLLEFGYVRSEFFGAATVEPEQEKGRNRRMWIDGFRIELAWLVSEDGAGQHP
jgi:hypothetical protein